jgi:exopolysaccharide biosynthesis protein
LSVGIAFDSAGEVRWIPPGALADRAVRQGAVMGFQSYPRLLDDGRIPPPLQTAGNNLDLAHRDARAAIGETRDGRILIALTRFDGLDGVLGFVPFGLTTPEMAAVMGALGAREAVMLDGGISSQLLIRAPDGTRRWRGLRPVPMGLVAVAR